MPEVAFDIRIRCRTGRESAECARVRNEDLQTVLFHFDAQLQFAGDQWVD
jgi:hypothetical protein